MVCNRTTPIGRLIHMCIPCCVLSVVGSPLHAQIEPPPIDVCFELSLSVPNGTIVDAGILVGWTITVSLPSESNEGLSMALVDLAADEGNPQVLALTPGARPASMSAFDLPAGYANIGSTPGSSAYGGTPAPAGDLLAQIGGAMNTFGVMGPQGHGQQVVVESGIGHGAGQELASGTFVAPTSEGEYRLRLVAPVATTIVYVETPPAISRVRAGASVVCGEDAVILVPPACPGDFNHDGQIDVFDFGILAVHFSMPVPAFRDGDMDGNAAVDVFDFGSFAVVFGTSCGEALQGETPQQGSESAMPAIARQATGSLFDLLCDIWATDQGYDSCDEWSEHLASLSDKEAHAEMQAFYEFSAVYLGAGMDESK